MNILLKLLYHFLRLIVQVSLPVFYRKTVVLKRSLLNTKGPLFLLSNHPSTVLDPFNVVSKTKRIVFFLANASLFKHPLANWILTTLYCIKVERYQDVSDRPLQNADAFEQSISFLKNGGCLYVAPEGTSEVSRRIRKIKTGTARIALAAEAANDFKLGVQILPVGLVYSNPRFFRETVIVSPSSLIQVANYKALYQTDEWKAVEQLTQAIHAGLSSSIIDTETEEEDEALRGMEMIFHTISPVGIEASTARSRDLLGKLKSGVLSSDQQVQIRRYYKEIDQHKISDKSVAGKCYGLPQTLLFILGLPFALFGVINHLLPCGIPWLINRKLNVWPCYDATYRYVSGLIFFPLFYFIQIRVSVFYTDWRLYTILLVLSGLFADYYIREGAKWYKGFRWWRFKKSAPESAAQLQMTRAKIIENLTSTGLLSL